MSLQNVNRWTCWNCKREFREGPDGNCFFCGADPDKPSQAVKESDDKEMSGSDKLFILLGNLGCLGPILAIILLFILAAIFD